MENTTRSVSQALREGSRALRDLVETLQAGALLVGPERDDLVHALVELDGLLQGAAARLAAGDVLEMAWEPFATTKTVPECWPPYMRTAVRQYLLLGHPMGGYLTRLFEGRVFDAVCNADAQNFAAFAMCCKWIAQCAPVDAFGSPAKVAAWHRVGGLEGIEAGNADPIWFECKQCGAGEGEECRRAPSSSSAFCASRRMAAKGGQ